MVRVKKEYSRNSDAEYHGLINQGSTCYLNSILQVLFMTKDFREAVKTTSERNSHGSHIDLQLATLFSDLKRHTARTVDVTQKLGIDCVYEQRDSAEYFEKILTLASTDASQIFQGHLAHATVCSRCSIKSDEPLPFWNLPLALLKSGSRDYSVVDGIREFFKVSEFHGENQIYCEDCCAKCDATASSEVTHHPEVLALLLKRFEFNYHQMSFVKNSCAVTIPSILTIPENQTYEIYAFVEHFGSLRSGHYTATIKSQDDEDDRWYNFNDSTVRPLHSQPFQKDNPEKSTTAYLLFYRKKNTGSVGNGEVPFNEGLPSDTNKNYDQCQHAAESVSTAEGLERFEETEIKSSSKATPRHVKSLDDLFNTEAESRGARGRKSRPHSNQGCYEERTAVPYDGNARRQRKDEQGMGGEAEAYDQKKDEIGRKRRKTEETAKDETNVENEQGHAGRIEGKQERAEAERQENEDSGNKKQLNRRKSFEHAKDTRSVSSGQQKLQNKQQVSEMEVGSSMQSRHQQQGQRKMDVVGGTEPKIKTNEHAQRAKESVTKAHRGKLDQGETKGVTVDRRVKGQVNEDDEQNQITEEPLLSETGYGMLAGVKQGAGSDKSKKRMDGKSKSKFLRLWSNLRKSSKKNRGNSNVEMRSDAPVRAAEKEKKHKDGKTKKTVGCFSFITQKRPRNNQTHDSPL